MAYSTQRATSDGSLSYLDISIQYLKRADINVFFDGLPAPAGSWSWNGTTDKRINFTPNVPDGVEVLLKRTTQINSIVNVFSNGAKFNNATMDQDFTQLLYLNQEAVEGAALTDIFNDIDFHGYKLKNLGSAVDDTDAITLGQAKTEGALSWVAAGQAAGSAADALNYADLSQRWAALQTVPVDGVNYSARQYASNAAVSASAASGSAASASGSATTATNAKTAAEAARDAAAGSASSASGSASSASTSAAAAAQSASDAQAAMATKVDVTQTSTGKFYAGDGARIDRFNDRVFIAEATKNNGTMVASQPDWLTTWQMATGRPNGFIQLATLAALNSSDPQNQHTMVIANRSSTNTLSGGGIGAIIMGINNNTSVAGSSYAAYMEAFRTAGVAGGATGLEIDTVNYSGAVNIHPYAQNVAQTVALQLAAGAELSSTGQFPSQAAINIQNNNSTFDKGIMFGSTSISGADGTNGTGVAIAFAKGHTMQWYGPAGATTSSILCTGTTTAASIQQLFSDNTMDVRNASGKSILRAFGVAGGVNGLQVLGAATGQAVALQTIGDDTNIPLILSPKGTGKVSIPNGIATLAGGADRAAATLGYYTELTASGIALPVNTATNVVVLPLDAGDWDVEGLVTFIAGASTTVSLIQCGIGIASATYQGLGSSVVLQAQFYPNTTNGMSTPRRRIKLTAPGNVYLIATCGFPSGSATANGWLSARLVA